MLQPQTAFTSGVGICREDEVYSPSDITVKPYYLKRNYGNLQMVKNLQGSISGLIGSASNCCSLLTSGVIHCIELMSGIQSRYFSIVIFSRHPGYRVKLP